MMKKPLLKNNDIFKVMLDFSASKDYSESLLYCYQPIIGIQAATFYQLLKQEKFNNIRSSGSVNFAFVSKILNISLKKISQSIELLEKYGLLKTYLQNNDVEIHLPNVYVFNILEPIDIQIFLVDNKLKSILISAIDQIHFNVLIDRFVNIKTTENLKNISYEIEKGFLNSRSASTKKLKNQVLDIVSRIKNEKIIMERGISKDIDVAINLFKLSDDVVFLLIKNNSNKQEELTRQHFQTIVKDYILLTREEDSGAEEQNSRKVEKGDLINKKIEEMESHDCISYFHGLHERPITKQQEAFLISLINKYKLKKSIINCIMEFSYFKNNFEWRPNYMEKIANTIAEKGIPSTQGTMNFLMSLQKKTTTSSKTLKKNKESNDEIIYSDFRWE